jgi:hypothetical protein
MIKTVNLIFSTSAYRIYSMLHRNFIHDCKLQRRGEGFYVLYYYVLMVLNFVTTIFIELFILILDFV